MKTEYRSKIVPDEKGMVNKSFDCPCGKHIMFSCSAKKLHAGVYFICADCGCISLEVWQDQDDKELYLLYGDYVKQMNLIGHQQCRSLGGEMDKILYLHICRHCRKIWKSEDKVSKCPKCEHQHIWFRGTSELK